MAKTGEVRLGIGAKSVGEEVLSKAVTRENDYDAYALIKVLGVGGAGCKNIDRALQSRVRGAEFIVSDTDAVLLNRSTVLRKIYFDATGLSSSAGSGFGRMAANAHRKEIWSSLAGAHMAFIAAGMGGGTGTGAAPVVAEVAGEMGIFTIGIVFKPFCSEGCERMKSADEGIAELAKHVDSLLVIPNDKPMKISDGDSCVDDCFKAADEVLKNTVADITEIIAGPCFVNVHFEDVRRIMGKKGRAMVGFASATGVNRARLAADQAVTSTLQDGASLYRPKGMIVNITAARASLKIKEINEVINTVKSFAAEDASIAFGVVLDESMVDAMRVTLMASGI